MTHFLFLAAQLLWGPYLQDVRPDRVSVQWSTIGPAAGAVRYFAANGAVKVPATSTALSDAVYLHKAVVGNLMPGTMYSYEIQSNGQTVAEDPGQRFTTIGGPPFRFLVLGDSGDGGLGQYLVAQSLAREEASFLLHAGDIAYFEGTFAQFESAFFEVYRPLLRHMPVYPAPGNHDMTDGGVAYRALFNVPGLYYSFDWANVHFTVLDSNQLNDPASGQRAWLERDLQETRKTWRIAVLHHPPFPSTDYKRDDPLCQEALRQLTPVFERQGVHVVISGHEHIYQRTQPRLSGQWQPLGFGTIYVTSGGGGSEQYAPGTEPWIAGSGSGAHYLRVSVSEALLRVEAVTPSGELLDTWQIRPDPMFLEDGILDAAAFTTEIAPGGLATILGWNLDGASIRDWPILYNDRTQINAQVPFESPLITTVALTAAQGSVARDVRLQATAPNLFSVTVDGRTTAAATHQDGRLVTAANPAAAGEWISLYATGLGRVRNGPGTGVPAPAVPIAETVATIQATLGGSPMEVGVACLAPGFVGLYQVNVRVPVNVPGGRALVQLIATRPGNIVALDVR